ncbi:MAG: threonine synthase [Plesiomonas sp.]|uniref:threonine synthase n=1 Tax=Plesiomonas sp. TaxID=2486279 RepID=UPI003F2CAEB5
MKLYNIKDHNEQVNFAQAVRQGLGSQQGLFFPFDLPALSNIDRLLDLPFVERSSEILSALIGDEMPSEQVHALVDRAFNFPLALQPVTDDIYALELFHGPTLAFKDFGGRFMAQVLEHVRGKEKITILTATSGDTGAAVAQAFYGIEQIQVVILYPKGKISPLQEKLFCTLGGNIHTLAVEGDFDTCQALVKQAFDDEPLRQAIGLNSANSINISRLLAQICYYFEAVAQLPIEKRHQLVVSVPSGNFGNLTAGLLAQSLGLPVKRFIAATNANDTVPRYLASKQWQPNATVATLSNSMDVSRPNNWPRIEELYRRKECRIPALASGSVSDIQMKETLQQLDQQGYLCEPHGATAYRILAEQLQEGETGIFLCTAHPAKFKESVEQLLDKEIELPPALAARANLPLLSEPMSADFAQLKQWLTKTLL